MRVSLCFARVASSRLRLPVTRRMSIWPWAHGALHRGALRDGKEVVAIASRASSAALGESERDRGGGTFDLIAQCGTGGLRQRGTHRGEFERDVKAIEAFVPKGRLRAGRAAARFQARQARGGRPRGSNRRDRRSLRGIRGTSYSYAWSHARGPTPGLRFPKWVAPRCSALVPPRHSVRQVRGSQLCRSLRPGTFRRTQGPLKRCSQGADDDRER
jgi:hypothetical protein